ncbi:MAG TPA: asparagine synthase (glutamine-hydrolyzing) [Tepidisphaeraceae bacterium]|jgi:asparagine synthase (glutamine-hydrolysing)|nr:asparagine synthase (glutamine-hydrolyzing) [Tepidisphaeraceae bacterium]
MCGIAGIIAWDERYRTSRHTLARMSDAIAHRGPDGERLWFNDEASEISLDTPQVAFAFRRLAVIDPDPRSMQPFTIDFKTMIFNGEIYNYRELREELTSARPDYEWRTNGDAEVLLVAYDTWKDGFIKKLNGMFALAIWDEDQQSLLLARDRMGQKPLYWTASNAGTATVVAFASELGALRRLPWFDATLSRPSLEHYLRYGYMEGSAGHTIFTSTAILPPATMAKWQYGRQVWKKEYYDPNLRSSDASPAKTVDRTRELVAAAVRRQLVSDAPLGVFLSGGIDSAVIAACAQADAPTQTFSIGFENKQYDETPYAREIAAHLGTTHHEFMVKPDAVNDLPMLATVFGEPFADSSALPTHYLARETRQLVTVALSGDGGDELFGGYARYRAMKYDSTVRRLPRWVRRHLATRGAEMVASAHPKSRKSKIARFLQTIDQDAGKRYASYHRLFDPHMIADLFREHAVDMHYVDYIAGSLDAWMGDRDAVQAALALDRISYLPNDLLTKVDRATMLHALEVRSPFLDPDLVTFAAGLETQELIGGGPKRMLREAFGKFLPGWVFTRQKQGFALPIADWFRNDAAAKAMLNDCLFASDSFASTYFNGNVVRYLVEEHASGRANHAARLYALLMLELWWRQQ